MMPAWVLGHVMQWPQSWKMILVASWLLRIVLVLRVLVELVQVQWTFFHLLLMLMNVSFKVAEWA